MRIGIIGPGFQINLDEVEVSLDSEAQNLAAVVEKYRKLIAKGEPFVLSSCDASPANVIYYPKPGDHFIVMTEKAMSLMLAQQKFAVQPQRGRH